MSEKRAHPVFSEEELSNLLEGMDRMQEQIKNARRVEVIPTRVVEETTEKPVFHHDLIRELYRQDMRIDHEIIRQILALPRETLIEDLHNVIYDSMARFAWFNGETEWNERTHNFILHALFLLTEMKAENSLQVVLDILRQDEEYIDYWFSDFLTEGIWESIYTLGFNKLDELFSFLKEPDRYCYCRTEISTALSQIALHHPERRVEVIDRYREMLLFFLNHQEDDRLIDSEFIGFIIAHILDIEGIELIPEIDEIYTNKLANPGIAGDLDVVIRELNNPTFTYDRRRNLQDIYFRYDEIVNSWPAYAPEDHSRLKKTKKEHSVSQFPKTSHSTKPGRNEPCPCGSGKKYKKCCLLQDTNGTI
jgi:hypothetical protein